MYLVNNHAPGPGDTDTVFFFIVTPTSDTPLPLWWVCIGSNRLVSYQRDSAVLPVNINHHFIVTQSIMFTLSCPPMHHVPVPVTDREMAVFEVPGASPGVAP